MKSYNHLFEKFISDENIELAIKKASIGKRSRIQVQKYLNDPEFALEIWMYAITFKNAKHRPIEIYDGIQRKKRTIIVPTFKEQIIHHMLVNVLQPIFMRGMYEHSYGSIPQRGGHKGKKTIEKWINRDIGNCKYVVKMDIKKYFDSIPHDIYLNKFKQIIHDREFMRVVNEITSVISSDKGIPLGFYTSQWTANWYLQDLDHYIKENLKAKYYIRYMDDMVIFGKDKTDLHKMRKAIEKYLNEKLKLKMKENWQVFRFDYIDEAGNHKGRFLDFMGFRFYCDKTILRKSIMIKATRKAIRAAKHDKPTLHEIKGVLSYMGWIDCTNTYGMYENRIKPYVNIRSCKKRISKHDKRETAKRKNRKYEEKRQKERRERSGIKLD